MTVETGNDAYKLVEDDQLVSLTQTEINNLKRNEPFKRVCSASGFTSQRETLVGIRNNVLLVLKP